MVSSSGTQRNAVRNAYVWFQIGRRSCLLSTLRDDDIVVVERWSIMIHGLRLMMRGEELREHASEQIGRLEAAVKQYQKDLEMDPKDQTDEHPCLPEHILESMIDECEKRIRALALIRDHVVADEQYLLDQQDLQFAEMLPPTPPPELICMGRR